jgi:hypothetical protein
MCNIWESCKNHCKKCLSCDENPLAENSTENHYVFNNWEDNEDE